MSFTPHYDLRGTYTEAFITPKYIMRDYDDNGIDKEVLMVCKNCLNADLENTAIFCWRCGEKIIWKIVELDFNYKRSSVVDKFLDKDILTQKYYG